MKQSLSILYFFTILWGIDHPVKELPIGLTAEEKSRIHEIYSMGRSTDPPLTPIRNIAEYERMSGALIRYPFGISTDIIREMAEDIIIYCLVSSSLQSSAYDNMNDAGVNMDNIEFVLGNTDSYWTRDYGPGWVVDGNRNVSVVDFTYNRPRPNDNAAPTKISELLGVPYFASDIVHAGGNYMTDGFGISASSDLVYEENDFSSEEIHQLMSEYYGIETYHIVDDPNNTYIDHIDCWGKYLSPTKILIREVPASHAQYDEIEATATYFGNSTNEWGEPWDIYRVWTPNNQPYTNSLILNEKVFVPIMNNQWDDEALLAYEEAMPGYEILPFTGSWESTDALHCRIKGIPKLELIQIFHNPMNDSTEAEDEGYFIEADIDELSNSGLLEDSLKIFWRLTGHSSWSSVQMLSIDIPEMPNYRFGYIPPQATETGIDYFIQAADHSGNIEKLPIGGYYDFLALPTDVCDEWLLGDMNHSDTFDVMDILLLADIIMFEESQGICSESVADVNDDGILNVVDILILVNWVLNPTMLGE